MMEKPGSCLPNPFGSVPFILGWEGAFLGNCLSSLANTVVFSIRTGIPAIYPNIDAHRGVFQDPDISRSVFDPQGLLDVDTTANLVESVNRHFEEYYPGYARRVVTTDFSELPDFAKSSGVVLFLPYHHLMEIRDWSENDMEARAANFCRQGNGLVLPGAFWNQYTDMREAAAYGPALRAHIGAIKSDGCAERAEHMKQHSGSLKIAIHIRQSDSRNWQGGAYYYEIEDYLAVIKHLHHSLWGRDHVFYVFSEMRWSESDFAGLPVFYRQSEFIDDFVTMGRCDYLVGPPSTFATWSAFLGGAKRIIITKPRIAALPETSSLIDFAISIPFPTGGYLPGDPTSRPV